MKPVFARPGTAGESAKMVGVPEADLPSLLGSKLVDDEKTYLWEKRVAAHCVS